MPMFTWNRAAETLRVLEAAPDSNALSAGEQSGSEGDRQGGEATGLPDPALPVLPQTGRQISFPPVAELHSPQAPVRPDASPSSGLADRPTAHRPDGPTSP